MNFNGAFLQKFLFRASFKRRKKQPVANRKFVVPPLRFLRSYVFEEIINSILILI